mgnify:CR=1 FL=1
MNEGHINDYTPTILYDGHNNDESPTVMNEGHNNDESPTLVNDLHNNDDSPTLMNEVHVSQKFWALFGNRWYAAELADPNEWPDELKNQLQNSKVPSDIVKFLCDKKVAIIPKSKIEPLGNTEKDAKRGKRDKTGYNLARKDMLEKIDSTLVFNNASNQADITTNPEDATAQVKENSETDDYEHNPIRNYIFRNFVISIVPSPEEYQKLFNLLVLNYQLKKFDKEYLDLKKSGNVDSKSV